MGYLVKCYLCDSAVVLPLNIIFLNILETSTFPNMWKLANVTPIFKKDDKKQLVKTTDQFHYSPFVVNYLKRLSSLTYIPILTTIA